MLPLMRIKTGLGFLLAAALAHAVARPSEAERRPRGRFRSGTNGLRSSSEPLVLPPASSPAISVGALATGAFAVGALAIGALAIGALAIGRLEIKRARFHKLEIDDLTVRGFQVVDEDESEDLEQDEETEN